MALDLAFNPPQFNEATYDPVKMRQLVDELERLHAALTAETGEGVEPVTSVFGRGGDVVAIQADYDAFFLTPAEGNAAYATLGHLHDGIADTNLVDKTADETVSGMWTFTHVPTSSIDGSILLSHVGNPILGFHETGATADNGVWNIVAFQESMRFRTSNDAGAADVNWLQVDRTGTTPTTIAFTGAVTGTSFGGITEANLLDKTAAETISGTYTFTAINNISSTTPFLNFTETGVTGVPVWWLGGDGGNFSLRLDNAAPYAWQVNTNAGNDTVTSVSIPTALSVVGAMTAGSYGGITEANLLDKSVAETITGAWTHTAALVINNTLPIFDLNESDGSLDNKRWRFAAQGEQLLLQAVNDAQSVGTSFLTVDRTGTTIDGVAILAPLTATSYDGILPTSWLDKTATETITGAYSFTNSTGVHIANDTGGLLYLTDSDAIANQGKWRFVGADGTFAIQTILDNETFPVAALSIFRTGTTVTAATFGCPLNATSYNGVLAANLTDKSDQETIAGGWTFSDLTSSFGGVTGSNLVDKGATETVSGAWTFSSNSCVIGGVLASNLVDKAATETITGAYSFTNSTGVHIANDTGGLLYLTDSDAIANQGKWRFVGADGAFAIQTILDNETSPVAALTIFRTGTTVTAATFGCPLNATSYNGVLQANLQDKTAAETITGTRTYSSANIDLADNILIGAALDDYSILDTDATVSANAVTITYSTSQSYNIDLEAATGNVTITVSGGPPTGNYGEMIVRVQQDTTANRTLTWAGGTFIWPGGVEVEPNTGSDAVTIYYLSTWDGGTIWAINGVHYS